MNLLGKKQNRLYGQTVGRWIANEKIGWGRGNTGEPARIKGHLSGEIKTLYNKTFLNYMKAILLRSNNNG